MTTPSGSNQAQKVRRGVMALPDGWSLTRLDASDEYSHSVRNRELGRAGKRRTTASGKPCAYVQIELIDSEGRRYVGGVNVVEPKAGEDR